MEVVLARQKHFQLPYAIHCFKKKTQNMWFCKTAEDTMLIFHANPESGSPLSCVSIFIFHRI